MFSALSQGSFIYVLDKTDKPKISTAKIIGISQPKFNNNQMLIDIKTEIDGITRDFPNILSSASVFSYNNGSIIISENQAGLEGEIKAKLNHLTSLLDNIEAYKKDKIMYEELLKNISPSFAKDRERDERLEVLNNKVLGMESKIDRVLELISKEK